MNLYCQIDDYALQVIVIMRHPDEGAEFFKVVMKSDSLVPSVTYSTLTSAYLEPTKLARLGWRHLT